MISITLVRCVEHCNDTESVGVCRWADYGWGWTLNLYCHMITKLDSIEPMNTLLREIYMQIKITSFPIY